VKAGQSPPQLLRVNQELDPVSLSGLGDGVVCYSTKSVNRLH